MLWTKKRISLAMLFVAAFAATTPWIQKHWGRPPSEAEAAFIAGSVVDEQTKQPIAQARISLVGRLESFVTEDNGNFRVDFKELPKGMPVRIQVRKDGYKPLDQVVQPTVPDLFLQLKRSRP